MPLYLYRCETCDDCFEIRHGITEKQERCQLCEATGGLVRIPQMPSFKVKKTNETKTGDLVKDYIKKNNQLLKEMKEEARNQVYED